MHERPTAADDDRSLPGAAPTSVIGPLSHNQRSLWAADALQPGSPQHTLAFTTTLLEPDLDAAAFHRALQRLTDEHPAMRTTIVVTDGVPAQVVHDRTAVSFRVEDVSTLDDHELDRVIADECVRSFDVGAGPLHRFTLLRRHASEHVLVLTAHHIVTDMWSIAIIVDGFTRLYRDEIGGTRPPVPRPPRESYAEFVERQWHWLDTDRAAASRTFWHHVLAAPIPPLVFPIAHPPVHLGVSQMASITIEIGAETTRRLRELAHSVGATLFDVVLASYQLLLSRSTGQTDICVGTPKANRSARSARTLGFFVNTIALRTDVSGNPTFTELIGRVHRSVSAAAEHDAYPFQLLVEKLRPSVDVDVAPFFQVLFAWQKTNRFADRNLLAAVAAGVSGVEGTFNGMPVRTSVVPPPGSAYDLNCVVGEVGDSIHVKFEYRSARFESASMQRMLSHLRRLLEIAVETPTLPVDDVAVMDAAERDAVIALGRGVVVALPSMGIHQIIANQAATTPSRTAVTFGGQSVTYAELMASVGAISRQLTERGVRPGDLVALHLGRCAELPAVLLAVLEVGAAYLPLDPSLPPHRIRFMLHDSGATLVLTERALAAVLDPSGVADVLLIEDLRVRGDTPRQRIADPARQAATFDLDSAAYVMYTSGSTGEPKAVQVGHRTVVNLLQSLIASFGLDADDTVLAVSSTSFDLSVVELFAPLSIGARVAIPSDRVATDADALREMFGAVGATFIQATPTMLSLLVDSGWLGSKDLTVVAAGEELSRRLADRLLERSASVWNGYGPTETHYATLKRVGSGEITIGTPIDNTHVVVVANGQVQPIGVPGELWVGGAGVALGYRSRPELTALRFVPDLVDPGDANTMYRTGDLVVMGNDGELRFRGRVDRQVKIRGHRIELGEIEAVLAEHPAVAQVVVTTYHASPDDVRLAAYVVLKPHVEFDPISIRDHARLRVPSAMVPASFTSLAELPRSSTGKLDLAALPPPTAMVVDEATHVALDGQTEHDLAAIWTEVLGIERIGANDNFFDLGGHSLLATQIVSRIRSRLHVELPVRELFAAPTIATLAALVDAAPTAGNEPIARARIDRSRPLPLSFTQERMWFLQQLNPDGAAYNMPGAVHLAGPVDIEALGWSLDQLLIRHETLRTSFPTIDGRVRQVIAPHLTIEAPVIDCRAMEPLDRSTFVDRSLAEQARRPFNLDRLPLIRIALYRLADDESLLFVNMHHIISDQWSLGVMAHELSKLYEQRTGGPPADLADLTVQYADYAAWQRGWLSSGALDQQLDYWKQHLAGLATLDLPSDRQRPAVPSGHGVSIVEPIPADIRSGVAELARREHASPFMVMLAAFNVLLHRYTAALDITVGTPIANRNFLESERLISSLVNTVAIRTDTSGGPTFRQLLRRVHDTTLDAFAHQDAPFEKVVEVTQPARDLSRSPLFQVFFNVQNAPFPTLRLGAAAATIRPIDRGAAQFDLSLSLDLTSVSRAVLEYASDLFDQARMERLLGHFWTLIRSALDDPDRPIGQLTMLSANELAEATRDEHGRCHEHDEHDEHDEQTVTSMLAAQVARSPTRTAVRFGTDSLTYQQLDDAANRLANHLISIVADDPIGPSTVIGICVERSERMLIAVLAVLKTGAAYVPLDPSYPDERLEYMLRHSGCRLVVTTADLVSRLCGDDEVTFVAIDDAGTSEAIANSSAQQPLSNATPDDIAYAIYTSGSTGRPKGVELEHRSVVNFLRSMIVEPGLTADDVLVAVTTLSFDIAVLELFGPLLVGAEVVIVPRSVAVDAAALAAAVTDSAATVMQATPTTWQMMTEHGWQAPPGFRCLCGGEAMTRDLADALLATAGEVWNLYGPTETTVWSAVDRVTPGEGPVSIGRPIANTTMHILDANGQRLPVGVPGELFIGGAGLARGYRGQPELTADRFIADPFRGPSPSAGPQPRLYRTGDIAQRRADGRFELLGRADNQIKIRGYRIELGEIESTLRKHPAVRDAVVAAIDFGPGDRRLVAYVIGASAPTGPSPLPTTSGLRAHLSASLPDYMVPSIVVPLDAFPLTPNNKVDRQALPKPTIGPRSDADATNDGQRQAPIGQLENDLAAIWQSMLGVSLVGRHDDFFDLGGHSLLAVRIFAKIEKLTNIQLPLATLFRGPTIAELATVIRAGGYTTPWTSLIPVQPTGSRAPLFSVAPFQITALSYTHLARQLGPGQPLYVLQPQGLESNHPAHTSVADIAGHYVEEIKQVQPVGPYQIGGHCAGNWVAFEIVSQLQRSGDEVATLILVDSEPPNIAPPGTNRIVAAISRLRYFWKTDRLFPALGWQMQLFVQRNVTRWFGGMQPRRAARVRHAHREAHRTYRATPIRGDITLIRSEEYAGATDRSWHLRWAELTTGRMRVEVVPGTHAMLLQPEQAKVLGTHIITAMGNDDRPPTTRPT